MALRLFRRRSVVVPTFAGGLVLAALLGLAGLLLARLLPVFLAPDAPVGRGVLVVEGWMDREELGRAAEIYRQGRYDALVVTGGPVLDAPVSCGPGTYAERAGERMRELGIVEPALAVVPSPPVTRDRTYQSALAVRAWLEARRPPVSALDVASHGPHSRRSRATYQKALGDGVEVGVISVEPSEYALSRWWESSAGVNDLLAETTGYAWMLCCFHPKPIEPAPVRPAANAGRP